MKITTEEELKDVLKEIKPGKTIPLYVEIEMKDAKGKTTPLKFQHAIYVSGTYVAVSTGSCSQPDQHLLSHKKAGTIIRDIIKDAFKKGDPVEVSSITDIAEFLGSKR